MNGIVRNGFAPVLTQMEPRLFDLDLQLIADAFLMILAVLVLFFTASYFLFNPARAMLEKRRNKIREELEQVAVDRKSAEDIKKEYDDRLRRIDAEAEAILSEARKQALANESKLIAKAKEEAAGILARAKAEAQLEKRKAADEMKKEMIDMAGLMAMQVLSSSMDAAAQENMINQTLKEIGESTWLS